MRHNRKYAVYINRDWFNALCIERYGGGVSMKERNYLRKEIFEIIHNFLSGSGELSTMLCETFLGPDGKMHKTVEFKIVEGRHSGKPLKRLKKKYSR